MRGNGFSEHHQNNNLKVEIAFANFIVKDNSFSDITKKEKILEFLNTKVKSYDKDPDKGWKQLGTIFLIGEDYLIDGYIIIITI